MTRSNIRIQSLPGRVRACPENSSRTRPTAGYAASVGRQRTAMEGPRRVSEGGITIRPGGNAKLRSVLKRGVRQGSPVERYGYSSGRNQVSGGFAFAKWQMILTGESPTSSPPGVGRPIRQRRNGQTMRRCAPVRPERGHFGDDSSLGRSPRSLPVSEVTRSERET